MATTTVNIQSTADETPKFFSAFLIGSSGVGKTVACSTLPKPIFIVADVGGIESVRSLGRHVDYIEVETYNEALDAFKEIDKRIVTAAATKQRRPWDSIVMDGMTAIEDSIKLLLLRDSSFRLDSNENALSLSGYGVLGVKMLVLRRTMLALARRHGLHAVFTALMGRKEVSGVMSQTADLTGKQGERAPGDLMCTFELAVEKRKGTVHRQFVTESSGVTTGKDRFNRLAPREPAHFRVILEKCGFVMPDDDPLPEKLAVLSADGSERVK